MTRDHGGGIDAAVARWGGTRADWLDLSTGINPVPYPPGDLPLPLWQALPDRAAQDALVAAARTFWTVPDDAAILATPGASAAIARLPAILGTGPVAVPGPTYNEHAAAVRAAGRPLADRDGGTLIAVHPNNPNGRLWRAAEIDAPTAIIDESFCDTLPDASLIALSARPGVVVLKSFGKFWGLAGLRLGFAIGDPDAIARLQEDLGPWPVSGPALAIGTRALGDTAWATATRARLTEDSARLDRLMRGRGAVLVGGASLFRLYEVDDAARWQDRLARHRVLARSFPHAPHWLRLGLPHPDRWAQLEAAL